MKALDVSGIIKLVNLRENLLALDQWIPGFSKQNLLQNKKNKIKCYFFPLLMSKVIVVIMVVVIFHDKHEVFFGVCSSSLTSSLNPWHRWAGHIPHSTSGSISGWYRGGHVRIPNKNNSFCCCCLFIYCN